MEFKHPEWSESGDDNRWILLQGDAKIGEVGPGRRGGFDWKFGNFFGCGNSATPELARAECMSWFWQMEWRKLAQKEADRATAGLPGDEPTERKRDLEQMCRDHFNEPVITMFDVGRLVGYAEDDSDCYLIVNYPNGADRRTVWHTCVGGYTFLDRLKGQHLVISYKGDRWDDFYRIDSVLELNGCPKVPEFIVDRRCGPWMPEEEEDREAIREQANQPLEA